MFFFNAFAFLEVEPVYKCQFTPGEWTYGTESNPLKNEYCSGNKLCTIDWSDKQSIHNLIVQLNMECSPKWLLGGLGFVFLLGIVIGCSTLTKLGDLYGRRPVYLLGQVMNLVLILAIMTSTNLIADYFLLFFLGLSITSRYYVGYTFNVEMCPKKQQVFVSTFQFIMESVVYLLVCAYFVYISSEWIPL